jgi:hypothetical protein
MTEIGEVSVRKRRSRQEIKRLVTEFESSGLRQSEFCHKHNLAPGTLQRGLRRRRMEVEGQSEAKGLVQLKVAGIQRNDSGPGTCGLEVVERMDFYLPWWFLRTLGPSLENENPSWRASVEIRIPQAIAADKEHSSEQPTVALRLTCLRGFEG